MKTLRNTTLFAVLLLIGGISSCKKGDGVTPDEQTQFKNSAQLFLDDNSSIILEGNDVVSASYADNTLKINFSKDGTDVALQIPNYDINSTSQVTYNNASVALSLARGQKSFNSFNIFIPVIFGCAIFVATEARPIKTASSSCCPGRQTISASFIIL